MEINSPFSYIFGTEIIKEDLSELKKNKVFANGMHQASSSEKVNPFTILNKYKYSKKILTGYFNKFIQEVFSYDCKFLITTSWMTKLGVGESVHHHNHQNSMWSAVFYFDEYTEDSCALSFMNPIQHEIPVTIGKSKYNAMTKDCAIQPKHNLLIFFPSWIYHYSEPNKEKERKSLAFNFMPTGTYGFGDSSYNPEWMR